MPTLLIVFFCFLSLLSHSYSVTDPNLLDDAINVTESNSSMSRSGKDDSFADIIDRALEKEFPENNEQTEATDPGSFNNSVAEQQAVLETVARVRSKKNDSKDEKSFHLHDVFNLDNENRAEDMPTLIDRKLVINVLRQRSAFTLYSNHVPNCSDFLSQFLETILQDNVFIMSNPKSKYPVLQLDLRLISDLVVVIVSATCGGIAFACAGQLVITGYLLAGSIIGPDGLSFVSEMVQWSRNDFSVREGNRVLGKRVK